VTKRKKRQDRPRPRVFVNPDRGPLYYNAVAYPGGVEVPDEVPPEQIRKWLAAGELVGERLFRVHWPRLWNAMHPEGEPASTAIKDVEDMPDGTEIRYGADGTPIVNTIKGPGDL